ncbi:uncharacterized protein BCR38DRAFT_465071 [Pseudomassariella vexata]|uniref:ABC transporter domain-containing protein n=1 Tax=Pseudomassariella vexata TaxID=1141098 RepID=A0A1Y2E3C8_9PEZI|nr:uncharacterized protein BCR38DRAFT_465071 [Pseudomassariella vexata]ORY66061.1 hypothetical protein BCR38DRAFT_465071 [Pseudomassariella vexata]
MSFELFLRQTWALTKKNLIIIVVRCWLSTSIRALILPILVLTLLLEIPNLSKDPNRYGVGTPAPVQSLASSMHGSKKLAIVESPGLGPDFPEVLKRITGPLDSSKVTHLDTEDQVHGGCVVDFYGNSQCYAVLIFNDTPLSGRINATWNYTIKADPSRSNAPFNVFDRNSNVQGFYLPLQLAVDNAIINSTVIPETYSFAYGDQAEHDRQQKRSFQGTAISIFSFVFFATMAPVAHHVACVMSLERESGITQLTHAITSWARIASYVITFDILYLPLWIILGSVFWALLLTTSSPAIAIFWQILTGWAITSASVFSSAFFKRSNAASIVLTGVSFLLACLTAYLENAKVQPTVGQVASLGLLFPSMNYVFFFDFMVKSELTERPANLASPIPPTVLKKALGRNQGTSWAGVSGPYFLWILLAFQIVGYPLLTFLVDKYLYSNNRRRIVFNTSSEAQKSHVAIKTTELRKDYLPSAWKRIFCCARKPVVKAVDGLSLVSQKRQILCLLGPNGAGKSTSLDMVAGFRPATGGMININASPSEMGHIITWNQIKGGGDDAAAVENLIERCDLTLKRNSLAGTLSGGMKRKIQMACMLVGGSTVCLMDEVTSGLDPISRRVIWNVILGERSRRTMVLTTHFLDECEVLSDHIIIISLGKMKCQGTPAELKQNYGGSYRVHIPKSHDMTGVDYPVTDHGDSFTAITPDSSSAAKLLSSLEDSKDSDIFIPGPTVEDVFLKVVKEPHALDDDMSDLDTVQGPPSKASTTSPNVAPTQRAIFFRQVKALFIKRLLILRTQWWVYLFALVLPVAFSGVIGGFLDDYKPLDCKGIVGEPDYVTSVYMYKTKGLVAGPPSANDTIVNTAFAALPARSSQYFNSYGNTTPILQDSHESFLQYVKDNVRNLTSGGLFVDNVTTPLVATYEGYGDATNGMALMNLVNVARSDVPIHLSYGFIRYLASYQSGSSLSWVISLYPAFFALYPTYERRSQVRALQYSNGVRALPLWFSHLLFDSMFVLVISVLCTVMIAPTGPFWGLGHMWLVFFLYGIAATLLAYIVSTFSRSQSAAFMFAMLIMGVMYVVILMISIMASIQGDQVAQDGTIFGLGLIFPIQNVMRAASLNLNLNIVRCREAEATNNPGSIYTYGGPILILIIQIVGFFGLIVWLDSTAFGLSMPKAFQQDEEKSAKSGRPDVDAEATRVEASKDDLLRVVHVSKSFGQSTAVNDVSLGFRGSIYLEGVDVQQNPRLAQRHLGVCPQFDALDLLTVREHLTIYARCKGISDIKADVDYIMSKVGISAHHKKLAAKLSGGNKRKLSLAIALLGNPPVLVLDEPSSAMDAASKRVLWKTLEAIAPGRSVLITTHSMEEADALATRAAIISKRLLAIGTTQELRKRHSNEYHVHLILKSAPLSTAEEMQMVASWVSSTFPNVQFEGENLGGQVRFIVQADSQIPSESSAPESFIRYLIETLEDRKVHLRLECYSIGAATMERVFLSVIKECDEIEDEDEKKSWWRF